MAPGTVEKKEKKKTKSLLSEEEKLKIEKEKLEKLEKKKEQQRVREELQKVRAEQALKKAEEQKKKEEKRAEEQKKKAEEHKKKEEKRAEEQKKKDEEKKKKDDERKAREDKEKKVAERFTNFFNKPAAKPETGEEVPECGSSSLNLLSKKPIDLKPNQTLAPAVRDFVKEKFSLGAFDATISDQDILPSELYLQLLKCGYKPYRYTPAECSDSQNSVECLEIIQDKPTNTYKVKLFQFHANTRPAYFGTWRKRSSQIFGRRPLGRDTINLDYDVDSDEEWEEEGAGESLKGSDSEHSMDEDGYEMDDCIVPHGYLSDEEQHGSDAEGEEGLENGIEGEHHVAKSTPLLTEKDILTERSKKLKLLHPKTVGPFRYEITEDHPMFEQLQQYKATYINV